MRIQNLSAVDGLVHIEVTGEIGFVLQTHLGTGPRPDAPDMTITLDEAAYRDLRSGALDPQSAFMNQQILVEGDMQKAMQLALAAIAPD
jgi:putative sterol carrier protein